MIPYTSGDSRANRHLAQRDLVILRTRSPDLRGDDGLWAVDAMYCWEADSLCRVSFE